MMMVMMLMTFFYSFVTLFFCPFLSHIFFPFYSILRSFPSRFFFLYLVILFLSLSFPNLIFPFLFIFLSLSVVAFSFSFLFSFILLTFLPPFCHPSVFLYLSYILSFIFLYSLIVLYFSLIPLFPSSAFLSYHFPFSAQLCYPLFFPSLLSVFFPLLFSFII